jgi:hypothetical protein
MLTLLPLLLLLLLLLHLLLTADGLFSACNMNDYLTQSIDDTMFQLSATLQNRL